VIGKVTIKEVREGRIGLANHRQSKGRTKRLAKAKRVRAAEDDAEALENIPVSKQLFPLIRWFVL